MLYLQARVHLEEVETSICIEHEFDGARVHVPGGPGKTYGGCPHPGAQSGCQGNRGTFLDNLLVAALDRTLALTKVDQVAGGITAHLDFDVARLLQQAFKEDGGITEGCLGLAPGARQLFREVGSGVYLAHALAATSSRGFDEQGEAGTLRLAQQYSVELALSIVAGHGGHIDCLRQMLGSDLGSHHAHSVSRWADEDDASLLARLDEGDIFGKEAVARMNSLGSAAPGNVDDGIDVQVALCCRRWANVVSLAGFLNMASMTVSIGVDGYRLHSHFAAGCYDAKGYLPAIGD